jgi:hypothetical protein
MEVDESRAGLGEFEFTVGKVEMEVLERFMQEVEQGWFEWERSRKERVGSENVLGLDGDGSVLVSDEDGNARVNWGWTHERLAKWLGMIVVGEVVRSEEGKS